MKVALFGGTGFVGSYIIDQLIDSGHKPRLLVRDGSDRKVQSPDGCEIFYGDISDDESIKKVIDSSDAVIYSITMVGTIFSVVLPIRSIPPIITAATRHINNIP